MRTVVFVLVGMLLFAVPLVAAEAKKVKSLALPKNISQLKELEECFAKTTAKVLQSVVGIQIENNTGSGVVISKDGYVLTAGHITVMPNRPAVFYFADGTRANGITLGRLINRDAGLMKIIDKGPWPFVEMGESKNLKLGQWCMAIGHPRGYQPGRKPVLRAGRILAFDQTLLRTGCPAYRGDSGGPLFDLDGRVIGICSMGDVPIDHNFYIPIDVFRKGWKTMANRELANATGPRRTQKGWENLTKNNDKAPGCHSKAFRSLVTDCASEAGRSVVSIQCDGKDTILGTIVSDGWVLTKASELKGKIVCKLSTGQSVKAKIVGKSEPHDLAMLELDTSDMPAYILQAAKLQAGDPDVGQWLVSLGVGGRVMGAGVLGAPRRKVPAIGYLMIAFPPLESVTRIVDALNNQADKIPLEKDDIITHVDSIRTDTSAAVSAAVNGKPAGMVVILTVKRGEKTIKIKRTLMSEKFIATRPKPKLNKPAKKPEMTEKEKEAAKARAAWLASARKFEGERSRRRDDFPAILQHHAVIDPAQCGGPVVTLDGKVVGINIARAGRSGTYCIPADVLLSLVDKLKSGRLAPAKKQKVEDSSIQNKPVMPLPKDIAELKALEARIKKVSAKVIPSVVSIQVSNPDYINLSFPIQGSGVVVSEDGYIMTAVHVFRNVGQKVTIVFHDGKTAQGIALGTHSNADAGLIKIIDAGKWPFAEKGTSKDLPLGSWCLAIGHPVSYESGRPPVVRAGRVFGRAKSNMKNDCRTQQGDSGGPIFDLEGKVIGISNAWPSSGITIEMFTDYWDRLVKSDSWRADLRDLGYVKSKGWQDQEDDYRKNVQLQAVFRAIISDAGQCTAQIQCNGKNVALGIIVAPDGWVLTKASELKGKIVCQIGKDRKLPVRVVGISEEHDLAMLKIDATELPVIPWQEAKASVGQWLAAPRPDGSVLDIGVLGTPRRKVPPLRGFAEILFLKDKDIAWIGYAKPLAGKKTPCVKRNDIITHVDGKPTRTPAEVIALLEPTGCRPGDTFTLTVQRGEEVLDIKRTLAERTGHYVLGTWDRKKKPATKSKRRSDFPAVMQHDLKIDSTDCGGPVVNLDGKVVGMNIARVGYTKTYCIPTDVLLELLDDLKSGKLAPKLNSQK